MKVQLNAKSFAQEWIAAWNSHDLEKILSHYAEGIHFASPNVVRYLEDPTGVVNGLTNLRVYFKKGLENNPNLHFDLKQVFEGVDSVTIHYLNSINRRLGAEVMFFDMQGKVSQVYCHYDV